jgi:hypothetical protein
METINVIPRRELSIAILSTILSTIATLISNLFCTAVNFCDDLPPSGP